MIGNPNHAFDGTEITLDVRGLGFGGGWNVAGGFEPASKTDDQHQHVSDPKAMLFQQGKITFEIIHDKNSRDG